ncbi:uncharacterized protein A4U43_C01F20930 [Asparagus officinalis]|uniref:FAR1 domain-containing protein n=1 Tax=Asparagus officinalis TaxID=4686 RepID=A0A5P1FRS3_ASPOF|nr:uncharacterized protein A4U43_C01F20930 [Asparagus officinalis]
MWSETAVIASVVGDDCRHERGWRLGSRARSEAGASVVGGVARSVVVGLRDLENGHGLEIMEYSSSEDDELIDHYVDLEDDIPISDVDQRSNEVTVPLHFLEHGENSMAAVSNTIGSDLLSTDGDVKNIDPYLNMEFESDSAARAFYHAYALRLGFGIRVARSRRERRKGVEVLVMKRFVCLKEGHHKKKVTDHTPKKKRKRLSIRDGCPAMMEVVRRGPDKWVVTKLVLDHTHIVVSPERIREIQYNRLTEHYILRRWTRKAKTGIGSDDRSSEVRNYSQTSSMARYSELFNDAIKFAEKGSTSPESYKIAKEMLQKAFAEIVGLEESVINADTNIGRN